MFGWKVRAGVAAVVQGHLAGRGRFEQTRGSVWAGTTEQGIAAIVQGRITRWSKVKEVARKIDQTSSE